MEQGLTYYQPQELSTRHKHIIALHAAGMRNKDIAKLMGYEPSTVSIILNDPRAAKLTARMAEEFIEELTTTTQDRIAASALEAFETMLQLLRNGENDRVKFTAAKDLLDRAGFKPSEQTVQTKITVTRGDLARLITALEESKKEPEALEMIQDSSGVFRQDDGTTSARK